MTPPHAQSVAFDLVRLEELRSRHQRLLEDYRRASAAVQEASKNLARLRTEASTHPTAAEILRKPGEQLRNFTVEQLIELQISPRTVQKILAAENRIAQLTISRDAMRADVARSTKFADQLEAFAKARNL
ncbi:MAG TPA: hypothetical protein VJ577_16660 [Burkholderiaceae bacterium]|nr:hypothetical protein [Burkholderiaceae bacterium]